MTHATRFRVLNLRRFRSHPGRAALSVVGIAVGTALVASILAVLGSIIASVEDLVDLAGRADVEVAGAGDTGFDEELFFEVAQAPGVEAAVPVVRSRVAVGGHDALLFGFDQRATALDEQFAERAREEANAGDVDGVFLSTRLAGRLGLSEGDAVTVYGAGTTTRTQVVGLLEAGTSAVNRGEFAVAALPLAQQFAGKPGRLDVVWAVAEPGVAPTRLEAALADRVGDRAVVSSPRLRAEQAADQVAPLRQELLVIAGAVLVVAGFLVFNTMSMTALERRRELATVRALGGRRRHLLAGFLGEAVIVGMLGSAVGIAAGLVVARELVEAVPAAVTAGFDVSVAFHVPAATIPLAAATGIGATVLAALLPARRAVSTPPVEAMRPDDSFDAAVGGATVHVPTAAAGVAGMATGVAMTAGAFGETLVIPGAALLTVSALVATWGLTGPITRATAWVAGRFRAAGALGAAALERAPRRTWATTAGAGMALALVVAIGGLSANERSTVARQFAPLADIDVVLQSAPLDDFPVATMPAGWEQQLEELPGVAAAHRGQFAYATLDRHRVVLQGFALGRNEPVVRLASENARRRMLAGEGILATVGFASTHGVSAGDTVELTTPTGSHRTEVLEVVEFVGGGLGAGLAAMSVERLEEWYGREGASWFELEVEPGAEPGAVAARVEELTAGAPLDVSVGLGPQLYDAAVGFSEQFNVIFESLAAIAVVAGALGILNTLMLSVLERRRELGILRAIGTSRRHLRRMILAEAAGIAVIGLGIGAVIGLAMHWSAVEGADELVGFPIDYAVAPAPLVTAAVVALVMSALGGLGPGRRAARVNVIEAIGYE